VVAAFSLVIFYFAVSVAMAAEKVGAIVDAQRAEMEAIEAEVKLATERLAPAPAAWCRHRSACCYRAAQEAGFTCSEPACCAVR